MTSLPYLVAAGDIACARFAIRSAIHCNEDATAALFAPGGPLSGPNLKAVVALGDQQYTRGTYAQYKYGNTACSIVPPYGTGPCSFKYSWAAAAGSVPIYPTTGNHEYEDGATTDQPCTLMESAPVVQSACGYEKYFSTAVVAPTTNGDGLGDYYVRLDTAAAHPILLVSLNVGQCDQDRDLCNPGGTVSTFLKSTLRSTTINPEPSCVVVFWHQARWSYYDHGNIGTVNADWLGMFNSGGTPAQRPDLALAAHDHVFQRFLPLDSTGHPLTGNPAIPEIVMGTGGGSLAPTLVAHDPPGPPAFVDTSHYGVEQVAWDSISGTLSVSFWRAGYTAGIDPVAYTCN